jgi:hypothetical protein
LGTGPAAGRPVNAEERGKCVFVLDDRFAVRELLVVHESNSRD